MPASESRPALLSAPGRIAPGLPGIWVTGLATLFVLGLLAGLVWIVAVNASGSLDGATMA